MRPLLLKVMLQLQTEIVKRGYVRPKAVYVAKAIYDLLMDEFKKEIENNPFTVVTYVSLDQMSILGCPILIDEEMQIIGVDYDS